MIPTKSQWQGYKKQFGIPDGLSSVKMGDGFQAWLTIETTLRGKRDYDGCLREIEKLIAIMVKYAKDLKACLPDKFGGKTLSEKHANYTKANNQFKEIFGDVSKTKANYVSLAKPLLGVQDALKKAQAKLGTMNNRSPQEVFSKFYSEQFRGINLPLKMLEAVNRDPDIKRGIVGFKSHANMLNNMMNKEGAFDPSEAFGHASTAIALLAGEVARK